MIALLILVATAAAGGYLLGREDGYHEGYRQGGRVADMWMRLSKDIIDDLENKLTELKRGNQAK